MFYKFDTLVPSSYISIFFCFRDTEASTDRSEEFEEYITGESIPGFKIHY